MKTCHLFLLVMLAIISACGNSKRPGLSDKELLALETPKNADEEAHTILFDSIPSGVKYTEERNVNVAHPPVMLDLSNQNQEPKEFRIADYYNKVTLVKIKHPLAESGGKFTTTWGLSFSSNSFSHHLVELSDKYIFVTDYRMGLFCYDANGNFLDTIIGSSYSKENHERTWISGSSFRLSVGGESITFNSGEIFGYLGGVSFTGDYCMFLTREGEVNMLNFYHIPTKTKSADMEKDKASLNFHEISAVKIPPKRPFQGGVPVFLNESRYLVERMNPLNEQPIFLSSFGLYGDTLCRFSDNTPKVKVQTALTDPDLRFSYIFNGQYTVRQQYCDTVFRMTADNRLMPIYVLNFGEKRADKRTGLVGDKTGKLFLCQWEESKEFIYLVYTENYDCPNTRKNDEVNFFHTLYDKKNQKLYRIPVKEKYPENWLVENPLPEGIPFSPAHMNVKDNMLYVVFTKQRLKKMMELKSFSALPEAQKNRVKKHYESLNEDEMLIMKME